MKLEERIKALIEEKINELGYSLVKVQLGREMGKKALIVFIDKEENHISLKDCEKVSRAIEPLLDEKDFIKEQYVLIVSSKGI